MSTQLENSTADTNCLKKQTSLFGLNFPGTMREHKNAMFQGRKWLRVVEYNANQYDYFKFLTSGEAALAKGKNQTEFHKQVYEGDDSFKGGTFRQFCEPHSDFDSFHNATKQISADKLWKKVGHSFDMTNTRKRVRSAYDGDYDHDKRYDMEPFTRRETKPAIARIVKMRVDSSFSWTVNADDINRFGGFVAAIVNMIEKNGFLVELTVSNTATGFTQNESGSEVMMSRFLVKKADEYLPVSKILKAMSAVWFRRAGFGGIIAAAEICGEEVGYGLGTPYRYGKIWERVNDAICIYSVPSPDEQKQILEKMIEMIGERK